MTENVIHCNWNWCRETFTNGTDFKNHFRIRHATSITFVKGKDWDEWLQSQTGQGSSFDSLLNAVPSQSLNTNHINTRLNGLSSIPSVQNTPTPSPEASSPPRNLNFSDYVAQSSPTPSIGSMSPSPQLSDMIANATNSRSRPAGSPTSQLELEAGSFMPRRWPSSSANSHVSANSAIDVETQLRLDSTAHSSPIDSPNISQSPLVEPLSPPNDLPQLSPPPSPPRLRRSSRARSKTPLPAPPVTNGRRSRANSISKPKLSTNLRTNSRRRTPVSRASSAERSRLAKPNRRAIVAAPPIECIHEDEESGDFIQHPLLGEVQVLGTQIGSFQLESSSLVASPDVDELADDTGSDHSYSVLLDKDYNYGSQFPLQTQAPYHSPSQSP
ncbi:hypothetical protein QCA50_005359 [Cerrena zonata]|uniref:C2H2-type domain-containing protein n=1 Tax=Cerrena zonata TaxID=2478898 RepID=A0AAW0GLC9_9APHY